MTTFSIAPAFAVPFVEALMPESEALNAELKDLFLRREMEGMGYANAQPLVQRNGLFESNFELFDWPDAPIGVLRNWCWLQLYRAIGELNGYTPEQLRNLHVAAESWFHITRNGGYFALHNHPMASWSGVYCVASGDPDPTVADNGLLTFVNPQQTATMYIDMAIARMSRPYACAPVAMSLRAGQLVLFPSWVLHEVRPFYGRCERITVAFNARFKMVGVEKNRVPIYR